MSVTNNIMCFAFYNLHHRNAGALGIVQANMACFLCILFPLNAWIMEIFYFFYRSPIDNNNVLQF